jgi:hypothetical protein
LGAAEAIQQGLLVAFQPNNLAQQPFTVGLPTQGAAQGGALVDFAGLDLAGDVFDIVAIGDPLSFSVEDATGAVRTFAPVVDGTTITFAEVPEPALLALLLAATLALAGSRRARARR